MKEATGIAFKEALDGFNNGLARADERSNLTRMIAGEAVENLRSSLESSSETLSGTNSSMKGILDSMEQLSSKNDKAFNDLQEFMKTAMSNLKSQQDATQSLVEKVSQLNKVGNGAPSAKQSNGKN